MKIPTSTLPWILLSVALLFAGVLAYGLYQGTLIIPGKGFHTSVNRAGNPLGFYALAAFYALLTGLVAFLLVAVLRADQGPATGPTSAKSVKPANPRIEHSVSKNLRFEISQDGRGGQVIARLDSGSHAFWWEFGGGNCIAFISVPTAEQWSRIPALAPHPRAALLQAMADNVRQRQCPGARAIIGVDSIVFEA